MGGGRESNEVVSDRKRCARGREGVEVLDELVRR